MSLDDAKNNPVTATSNEATQQPYSMPIDLNSLIIKTFLSLYDVTSTTKQTFTNVDYVFQFGSQRIFLFEENQELVADDTLTKRQVNEAHIQVAKRLFTRFEQCLARVNTADKSTSAANYNNFYIGVSKLTTTVEGVQKEIAHDYGSAFYKKYFAQMYQHSTHDFGSDSQADQLSHPVLQVFSLDSLRSVLKVLPTPIDFLLFINFYKYIINSNTKFRYEAKLAPLFLLQPAFFAPAYEVQRKLVAANMLDKVESRLEQACESIQVQPSDDNNNDKNNDSENKNSTIVKGHEGLKVREALVPKMHQYAELYHKMISSSIKNRYKTNEMLPLHLVRLLISESMYTRLCLMEEFMAYPSQSAENIREGYERHQHSFNVFGRHYMMIFYGTDPDAFYSRDNIKHEHEDLLLEINAELQHPVMQDIFILGFEFIPTKDENNSHMEVVLDIYHRRGAPLTDSDKARLKELES